MKLLQLEINSCKDCPYSHYDGDYGRSYDSGMDCKLAHKRIIDDGHWDRPNCLPDLPPDWCPLPEKH